MCTGVLHVNSHSGIMAARILWPLCLLLMHVAVTNAQVSRVFCETTAGDFTIRLNRKLSPLGVDRFLELVESDFFTDMILYRVIPGFLVQFGVAADPNTHARWNGPDKRLKDEPNLQPFEHGTVSFAGAGTNSRTSHVFVTLKPNGLRLGHAAHETTIGHVEASDMSTWERVASNFQKTGYKDTGSLQRPLVERGNAAASSYPKLDRIKSCKIISRAEVPSVEEEL